MCSAELAQVSPALQGCACVRACVCACACVALLELLLNPIPETNPFITQILPSDSLMKIELKSGEKGRPWSGFLRDTAECHFVCNFLKNQKMCFGVSWRPV